MTSLYITDLKTFDLVQLEGHEPGCLTNHAVSLWARMDRWTPKQACLLLSGLDPKIHKVELDDNSYEGHNLRLDYADFSPHAQARDIWGLSDSNEMFAKSSKPIEYLIWAAHNLFPVPSILCDWVIKLAHQIPYWGTIGSLQADFEKREKYQLPLGDGWIYEIDYKLHFQAPKETKTQKTDKMNPKRKSSLHTLIAGMARTKYSYDPNALQNHTGTIRNDLQRLGLDLDPTTIKKCIDESFEVSGLAEQITKLSQSEIRKSA